MKEQERKAGGATTQAPVEWTRPKVNRLVAGGAEGSPVNATDLNIPS